MSGLGTGKLVETLGNDDLRHSEVELDRAIEGLKGVAETGRSARSSHLNPTMQSNGGVLMNIQVELHAVFGATKLTLAELSALSPGSTVLLDRHAGDPVDIFANGVRIATGEMVLLEEQSGRFGFRLLDIMQ
jgi:flagellar motor switch protein FliN